MPFVKPSEKVAPAREGDNVQVSALADEDALVVVRKIENKPEITTVNGVSDAVAVDLLVVSGRHAGKFEEDRLIFNSGLRDSLEGMDKGEIMAGRVVWKATKNRRMAVLADPSERDVAEAERAWDKRNSEKG